MSVSGHEWFVNGVSETARKNERGNQRKHLSHLRRTTIQSRRSSRERKNKDLRTHKDEMRQLINDFESTAPVNDMQRLAHYHVYSKERGCESMGHAAASFFLHLLTCYLFIHYYN